MALAYNDSYGPVLDTGIATAVAARANTEIETHQSNEVDTGSNVKPVSVSTTHVPHREVKSPR